MLNLLRRLPISVRLYLGFGSTLILLVAALLVAGVLGHRARGELTAGLDRAAEKTQLMQQLRTATLMTAVAMRNLVLQTEVVGVQAEEAKAKGAMQAFNAAREQLGRMQGLSTDERAALDEIVALEKQLEDPFTQAVSLALGWESENSIAVVSGQVDPLQQQLFKKLDAFIELQERQTRELFAASARAGQATNRTLIGIGIAAAVLATLATLLMIWSITRPLAEVVEVVNRVAVGDLRPVTIDDARDEVAQVQRALASMTESLTTMVRRVRESSESIVVTSSQIVEGNNDLSTRTETQAAGLQQTAASMHQLTSTIRANAASATDASELAATAARDAQTGGDLMTDVVGTMESIRSASSRVGDIINVIDEISFQTNILALNAAVEAARAGEHGRSFAVVAAEVRALAQRSAAAGKEIKTLIVESTDRVAEGSQLVSKAGTTVQSIVRGIRAVTDAIGSISVASQQQADGIREISAAITQVDTGTQQNAALVNESASAAENLKTQAEHLSAAVSQFKAA